MLYTSLTEKGVIETNGIFKYDDSMQFCLKFTEGTVYDNYLTKA